MNDTLPPSEKTDANRKLLTLILAVAAFVVIGVWVLSSAPDEGAVKAAVDRAIAQIQEQGKARGRNVVVSYGQLQMEGSLLDRHAVLSNVKMDLSPLDSVADPAGKKVRDDAVSITTPHLLLTPNSTSLTSVKVTLPEPIRIAATDAPDKTLMTLTASAPLETAVAVTTRDGVAYHSLTTALPASVNVDYLREKQAQGAEDATPEVVPVYETLMVEFPKRGSVMSDFANDGSGLGTLNVQVPAVEILNTVKPDQKAQIAEIKVDYSNSRTAQARDRIAAKAVIGPITLSPNAAEELRAYTPLSLRLDGDYEEAAEAAAAPAAQAGQGEAAAAPKAQLNLRQLELSTQRSQLHAQGAFVIEQGDTLPVGKAQITLTNLHYIFDELRTHQVLPAATDAMLQDVLPLITGVSFVQTTDLDIHISREKDGQFLIGNTTFEGLTAAFLKHALGRTPPGAAPEPSSAAPSTAPAPEPSSAAPSTAPAPAGAHTPKLPPQGQVKTPGLPLADTSTRG